MEKPKVIQTVGLVSKAHLDRRGVSILKKVEQFFKQKKIALQYDENTVTHLGSSRVVTPRTDMMESCDVVVSLGGDGTLIRLAHDAQEKPTPILSIHLGTMGFLTEVHDLTKVTEKLKRLLEGRYHFDTRSLLRITVYRGGKKHETFLSLNEAVVNQGNFARLIDLRARINQRSMVRFKADGVIIATPTGSTGHSLSAGGPIVHPKLDAFIFTPICPATLAMRPIVIPNSRELTLVIETQRRFKDNELALTVDGQRTKTLKYGDHIRIRRSARVLPLIRFATNKYYRGLRDRLGWGD